MTRVRRPSRRDKKSKLLRVYLVIIALIGSFVIGLHVGRGNPAAESASSEVQKLEGKLSDKSPQEVDFKLFWDVWSLAEEKFINKPLDYQKMLYGAISGALQALDDPYTDFLTPEDTENLSLELDGSFEGIGAEISIRDQLLTIITPIDGSPAENAGLLPGDIIYKIDDTETLNLSLNEAVNLIRGPKKSRVTLSIIREGFDQPKDYVITRDEIDIKSAKAEIIENQGQKIGYLEITSFSEDTAAEFKSAVTEILKNEPQGIILDLRNNPGGILQASIDIAGEFIPKGEIGAIEKFSDGRTNEFRTETDPRLNNLPLVIVVNEGSASASEILAGALRAHLKAILIGQKTFGKGSVQELISLKDGSSVRISVAKWLTPANEDINEQGLQPDLEVELSEEDRDQDQDPQLDEAIKIINKKIN